MVASVSTTPDGANPAKINFVVTGVEQGVTPIVWRWGDKTDGQTRGNGEHEYSGLGPYKVIGVVGTATGRPTADSANQRLETTVTVTVPPPPPTISNVAPIVGPETGGTPVTLTGTNFIGATSVGFGAASATGFSVTNATTIACTTPAGTGSVQVQVRHPAGNANRPAGFTYQPAE